VRGQQDSRQAGHASTNSRFDRDDGSYWHYRHSDSVKALLATYYDHCSTYTYRERRPAIAIKTKARSGGCGGQAQVSMRQLIGFSGVMACQGLGRQHDTLHWNANIKQYRGGE
jgi:hypothetical protein